MVIQLPVEKVFPVSTLLTRPPEPSALERGDGLHDRTLFLRSILPN